MTRLLTLTPALTFLCTPVLHTRFPLSNSA